MAYQGLEPSTDQLTFDRMGAHEIRFNPQTWWGSAVNLTGFTLHLWLAVPQVNNPIPIVPAQLNPGSGYTITTTQVSFVVTEADLNSWGLNPGTYAGCLLASDDGGATTDLVWTGNFVINSGWLTNTF